MIKKSLTLVCDVAVWRTGLAWMVFSMLSGQAQASNQATNQITLFAAASIAPILENLATDYEKQAQHKIRISGAASSVLARQVASGAPADIIVLANPAWMQWLDARQFINRDSQHTLIGNRLALLRHTSQTPPHMPPLGLKQALEQAVHQGRIAMADPDHVPAGLYGKAALQKLGLWQTIAPALARSANAPGAVALLARGEVSAAISYQTDARLSDRVMVQGLFPSDLHPAIRYQIALVSASPSPAASELFNWLINPDRQAAFLAAGFTKPVDENPTDD